MRGVYVIFDSLVICEVLGLEPSSVDDMCNFDLITCHYDMKTYHHEAYLNTSILFQKVKRLSLTSSFSIGIGLISFRETFWVLPIMEIPL